VTFGDGSSGGSDVVVVAVMMVAVM
jgi:hypothetical protein